MRYARLHAFVKIIFDFCSVHQLAALFIFLTLEEAGLPIPIPGDVLVAIAGARHNQAGILYPFSIIGISTLAVFTGSSILYWVVRKGGRPILYKYGKFLHINLNRADQIEEWFRKRGAIMIIAGRLIPGLRIPTTVMSGVSEVPYLVFFPSTFIAAAIWSSFYFFAGDAAVRAVRIALTHITGFLDETSDWVTFLFIFGFVFLGIYLYYHLRQEERKKNAPAIADSIDRQ